MAAVYPIGATMLSFLILMGGFSSAVAGLIKPHNAAQFQDYWYPKGAEISRFTLDQARYGGNHQGDAVLIFVTEEMHPTRQVKADRPGSLNVPILKLNLTRKFYTGLYPYSMMASIFTPVDYDLHPLPLKISFTSQEWCGHVFAQLNLRGDEYKVQSRSYFEKESDRDFSVPKTLPEDALWNLIRIAPGQLPQGEFVILPGTVYTRLMHRPMAPVSVIGKTIEVQGESLEGNALARFTVTFGSLKRTLQITFERRFPYRIQSWQDSYPSADGKVLTTRAERTHTLMIDYWNRNDGQDRRWLKKLGLKAIP